MRLIDIEKAFVVRGLERLMENEPVHADLILADAVA